MAESAEARKVLMELDERLRHYDASRPWDIDPDGQVHNFLSSSRFSQELQTCCADASIKATWTQDYQAWRQVARLYSEIVRDCPLSISREDYEFTYLARLEIDNCEPSTVIMEANPGKGYVGWNWKFTINDGRTFNMPFTSG